MIILGIDPALCKTGYGVIRINGSAATLLEGGTIVTKSGRPFQDRIVEIARELSGVLDQYKPDQVAMEDQFTSKQNRRTAILLARSWGAMLLAVALRGIPVGVHSPASVKAAVAGTGRATKQEVARAVCGRLRLKSPPKSNDVTDALAIALCHAAREVR